jgi:hypothetical protein
MTIQEIKDLINFCNEVNIPPREVYNSICNDESDFFNGSYWFVHKSFATIAELSSMVIDKGKVTNIAVKYISGYFVFKTN